MIDVYLHTIIIRSTYVCTNQGTYYASCTVRIYYIYIIYNMIVSQLSTQSIIL